MSAFVIGEKNGKVDCYVNQYGHRVNPPTVGLYVDRATFIPIAQLVAAINELGGYKVKPRKNGDDDDESKQQSEPGLRA